MSSVTYDYNIASSIDSGKIDLSRLTEEIQESTITIAQDGHAVVDGKVYLAFKAPLLGSEPQTLVDILKDHSGEPVKEIQEIITHQEFPRGRGFRMTTPDMTSEEFKGTKWCFYCDEGKQVLFRKNKVMLNTSVQNVPPLIFEVAGLLPDGTYCTGYQNRYEDLKTLATTSDCFWAIPMLDTSHGVIERLEFKWPNYSSVDRDPSYMNAGGRCSIYFTDDPPHEGEGSSAENEYHIHPIYGVKMIHEYTQSANLPSFPTEVPEALRFAQVCVHCVSHDAGELV